ncbi:MAG: efflux RND transporter periplasmic adaptor subunit [Treponema sp.]|nr:efflux RND transporter periplasmic adaptor subunit [Treponema sp.]
MKIFSIAKSKKIAAFLCTAGILVLFSAGCVKKEAETKEGTEAEETVYAVNACKTKPGNLDNYLEFGGDVASVSAVDVLPDQAGKISRILVNLGDFVKKDQVIAYVDASRPGYTFAASPVKAPINGRITSFSPTVGTQVVQSMSIAKISDTDDLEIRVNVPERFISRIALKQKAVLTFDAYPGEEFVAEVTEVSPVLDTTSRTMAIKIRVINNDPKIKVGMYARVKLITDSIKNALLVPSAAVIQRDGKPYVFTVLNPDSESPEVQLTSIKPGITVDDWTEILEGISAGDVIVIKGQSLLNGGSKVKIVALSE